MRLKKMIFLFLLGTLALTLPGSVESRTIKICSVPRPDSPWYGALEKLGREWEKITGGRVKLEIHPGETVGSEKDIVKEMKKGKLDGAAFFSNGMPWIYREAYVFNIPLVFFSREEHDYVFNKMKPHFGKRIEREGFKVIAWSLSGWVRLFSKHPIFYPGDLQEHKLSFTTWNPEMEQAWRDSGLHPVATDFKNLGMALESGMIDAFFLSPLIAEAGEYFKLAPNMGASKADSEYWCVVFTKEAWDEIPDRYKMQMEETAQRIAEDLCEEVIKLESEAVERMETRGLMVNKLPADALEEWRAVLGRGLGDLMDNVFSKEDYELMLYYLNEYRQSNKNRH